MPMQTTSRYNRAAFFDVDYTILANNSVSLFLKFMRREGRAGWREIALSLYYLARYKLGRLDFEKAAEREVAKLAGQSEAEMIALCNRWFEEMVVHYIYPQARDLIEDHRAAGDLLVLLSAASAYLVKPLADHLKIDHYLCNRPEVSPDGKFTGKILRPLCYGAGKITLAETFAREQGLDLSRCSYYSDSITDLPVLLKFGEPRVVNPDPLLRQEAKKRGWRVLDFSKTAIRV
jgi:HAD superfamily hydrolase (TIGR01490 family)